MFRFILHKLFNKRWMALCLLIGNILMVAITCSNPLYSNAILQKTLSRNLANAVSEDGINPSAFTLMTNIAKTLRSETSVERLHNAYNEAMSMADTLHMPLLEMGEDYYISTVRTVSQMGRRTDPQNFSIGKRPRIEDNIELISGRLYSGELVNDNTIEIIVSERMMRQYDLLLGDRLELPEIYVDESKTQPFYLEVVGIYRAKEGSELYWSRSPQLLCSYLVMDGNLFDRLFASNDNYPYGIAAWWYICLDYTKLQRADVPDVLAQIDRLNRTYDTAFRENISDYITNYASDATQLNVTLLILQTPILVLVCAFIFMVSRQLIELEENEIAVIKSRGARRGQILHLYLLQGLLLSGGGLVLGLPLGFLVCIMLGASNSFLEFVQRSALPVSMTWDTLFFALGAAAVACATMVLPAVRHANLSIVSHKVGKQRHGNRMPWWQKGCVDLILIALSLYSVNAYNSYAARSAAMQDLDILLYFSSSLFILGVGLLGIRLIPYLIQLIFIIGKRLWSPALYTSFQRIVRTKNSQTFIMLFLVFTIALGIFNADTARSINTNNEEQLRYMTGCDVRVMENWLNAAGSGYTEPNFNKYEEIEGVRSATRVYWRSLPDGDSVSTTISKQGAFYTGPSSSLMGVESKEFGETVWFKDSLSDVQLNRYLNTLTLAPDAILLSSNFTQFSDDESANDIRVGDTVQFTDGAGNSFTGTVYGFFDYWPGYSPDYIDETLVRQNPLIVANLAYLQSAGAVQPYEVWLDFDGSTAPIYQYAADNNLLFTRFDDVQAEIVKLKNGAVLQGTNGMLTTDFIVILLLCTVGFLIYWILSIQSRTLQFGIFRAMGMSMREIITMLVSEQVMISGTSIGIGLLAGMLSSRIFVPILQAAYLPEQQVLPMETVSLLSDMLRLGAVIGIMIVVCLLIIGWIVSRIKISQALKLGED